MNFLNNAIAQVSELFRSMTPGARITAGLLLAVVVASFGYLFRQSAAGPDAFLFGGAVLSDGDLHNIEVAVGKAGLSGLVRDGNRVRVPAGQQAAYLAAIADAGAQPSNFNTIFEDALGKTSPWEPREQAKERLKDARQRQLSEIVRAMSWVQEAVVIFDEQEPKGLARERKVTASISVQPKAGEVLDPRRGDMLRKFVSSAVLGLQPGAVTITNLGDGGALSGAMDAAMFEDPYYKTKVDFEQYKRDQILRHLSYIPGALVEVNAELDDTASEMTTSEKLDGKNVVTVTETTSDDTSKQTTADGAGRPGAVTNSATGPGTVAQAQQQQKQNETESHTSSSQTIPSVEKTTITRQRFTPKNILATVAIPTSYFKSVWKERNPDAAASPKPEDLKLIQSEVISNIETAIVPLVSNRKDIDDTFKRVKVIALDSLPTPAITPPSLSSKALAWTGQYWNSLAMLGVAMFSLMVMRSVVKGAPPSTSVPSAAVASAPPALTITADEPNSRSGEPQQAGEPTDDRPRLRLKKGTSVKDDLLDIVREDPDAAADILRSWIGKAG